MSLTIPNHYGGGTAETCSYSGAFQAKNIAGKTSEVLLNKAMTKGEVGALIGKAQKGELTNGTILFKNVKESALDDEFAIIWDLDQFMLTSPGLPPSPMYFDEVAEYVETLNMRRLGKPPPAVPLNSASVGNMTDEDAAILFVKSKDEIAASKGIPIQGANPALDAEVYAAIADVTGYTTNEIIAKIAAYKGTGKKLSSLKKQVLKNDQLYKTTLKKFGPAKVSPAPASPQVTLPTAKKSPISKKATAKKDGGWTAPKEFTEDVVDLAPKTVGAVPDKASIPVKNEVVDQVKQSVAGGIDYDQEDLVKAFIKAKDELAANPWNTFNLYSKGPAFDDAMKDLMQSWGMDVKMFQVNKAVAEYVASGKKVSALKKKMIASGEMDKLAPTLKKTPVQKVLGQPATNSEKQAKNLIDEAIKVSKELDADPLSESAIQSIFSDLKDNIANYKGIKKNMQSFLETAEEQGISVSRVIKAFDAEKAKALGLPNAQFYEKQAYEFLATQEGKDLALKKFKSNGSVSGYAPPGAVTSTEAKTVGTLGPENEGFAPISSGKALQMHERQRAWDEHEKASLKAYTGSYYHTINGYHRKGEHSSQDHDVMVHTRRMDSAMRPLDQDVLLHRGTELVQFGATSPDQLYELIGKTVTDKGYLSTSVGGQAAFNFKGVLMEIEAPIGTKGAYVKPISSFSHENELILARGTKMKVIQVRREGGQMVVRVRVVGQEN